MATIDQLNFEVILDDKEFNAKVKEDIRLANELNTSLSQLLTIKNKVGKFTQDDVNNNRKANKILEDNAKTQERITREKDKTRAMQDKLNASIQRATKSYQVQSRILNELKGYALGYLSVHGASQLLSSLVRVTGEFELQKTTLAAMIGDLNTAENIIAKIQGLAVESPFQFKELTTYAKQLSAFSVPAQELYDTTKMLADVSAGLGVGMDRIVLAYGQVRSAAFLRGQEVRQFTEAGIPILDELAKQFTELEGRAVSTGEVFDKISARLVPFEMVAKVFKDMTSEGGKFYNMQEVQAETLKGKLSNLKDAYEVMLNEIGKSQSENLKGAVDWVRRLMTNYEETGRVLIELISTYGVYKGVLLAAEVATNTFALAHHKLIASLVSVGKYLKSNPYVMIAAGITAAGYALYKNHTQLEGYEKIQKSIAKTNDNYIKDISKETSKLDSLYAKLKLAKKGTEEYNEAKKEIYTQYSTYISELRAEGVEVNDLAGIYDNLKTKIEDAVKARTSSKAKQKLAETYDQEIDSYYDEYIDIITKAQAQLNRQAKRSGNEYKEFSEFEKAGFWKYLTGALNKGDLERTPGLERVVRVLDNANIDAAANLKHLRNSIIATTKQYEQSLKDIKAAYGEIETDNGTIIPPLADPTDSDLAVKALQKEIEALQTLKKEYDEWKALGASDESISLRLQGYFPNIKAEYGEDFITQLNFATRILEKIKEIEAIAPDEAFNLMTAFGLDKASLDKQAIKQQQKAFEDSAKAANKYYETLRKWATEDFNLNGEGIALDISKIASDLNQKIEEIELRAAKAKELFAQIDVDSEEEVAKVKDIFVKEFGADAWEDFWNSYYVDGSQTIEELADKQIEYERKLAQEKVNDLAEKYVKESYFTEGIDLSDLGDKTFLQLRGLRKKLQDILEEEPLTIPAEVKADLANVGVDADNLVGVDLDTIFKELDVLNMPIDEATQSTIKLIQQIQQAGVSTDKFGKAIKKVFSGDLKELTEEEGKALVNMTLDYLDELSSLFDTIGEYALAAGNDSLKEAANGISAVTDVLGPMAEKFAEGDWLGAIISGVTSLTSKIFEALTAQEQLARAIEETAIQQRILNSEYAIMEDVEGGFGTDSFKKFTNTYQEATEAYKEVQKDLANSNKNLWGGTDNDSGQWGKIGGLGAGAAMGAVIGSILPGIGTAVGAGIGALIGMITGAVTDAALELDNYVANLEDMANEIGAPLINEKTGAYNLDTLNAIKDTYKELSAEDRQWLDNAIANTEIYENALTAMADYMSSVFSSVADDIANAFITSFKESEQAALDYAEIMDGIASQIARDVIKSTLIQNVFNEELERKAAMQLASGDTAGAMAIIEQALQSAQDLAPYIQSFLESMEPYFQMEDEGTADLGEGVKGVTEDTANLLASYLNAIRADVSFQKAVLSKHLPAIGESMPTIMDHLAQIQANTFDISQSNAMLLTETQSILGELRSVMTSDGGDTAIRIYS